MEFMSADKAHLPQLKELWALCFGDEQQYIDLFFDNRFREDECLIGVTEGEVVTMLFTLPIDIRFKGKYRYPACYIYAVATHPRHRGKGYSTRLMEYAHGYLYTQGKRLSVLVPATESLFGYYAKQGFHTQFYCTMQDYRLDRSKLTDARLESSTLPALKELRDRLLGSLELYGSWDQEALAYNQKELELLGGKVVAVAKEGKEGYAVCYPTKEGYTVKELVYEGDPQELVHDLMAYLGCTKLTVRLTPQTERIPFAMARWYCDKPEIKGQNSYLGLVLD